jgi:class 3 adenylate cyclase
MSDLPTGTVTLLFSDLEGSTRLLQQLGERYADVLAECRHLLRQLFVQYHGREVDTQGDAFFVAFARATDAVSAAAAIHLLFSSIAGHKVSLYAYALACIPANRRGLPRATLASTFIMRLAS